MPLDILVLAEPQEVRNTADWLRGIASSSESGTSQVHSVRSASEGDWQGAAGDAMRAKLEELGKRGDGVADLIRALAGALVVYADEMDTVRRRMNDAREIATREGLTVTAAEILDPPSWSADPSKAGPGYNVVQNEPDHAAKVADRQRKIDAYHAASQSVTAGRETQDQAESALNSFLSGQLDKAWVTAPVAFSGWAGVQIKANQTWTAAAENNGKIAAMADEAMKDPKVPAATRKALIGVYAQYKTDAENRPTGSAADSKSARALGKMPTWAQKILSSGVGNEHFKLGGVGGILTGVSIGQDIYQGKDAGKSIGTNAVGTGASVIAGGAASIAGGSAVLTVGVPLVVGTVVTTGAGWVYDEIASGKNSAYTTPNGSFRTPPMSR